LADGAIWSRLAAVEHSGLGGDHAVLKVIFGFLVVVVAAFLVVIFFRHAGVDLSVQRSNSSNGTAAISYEA